MAEDERQSHEEVDGEEPVKRQRTDVPCGVCARATARYRCPRCAARTCSAQCVTAHKAATGCSGKRDVAQYASLPQFDDALLLRDYRFLEETGRCVEVARREAERAAAEHGRGRERGGRGRGSLQPGPGGALQLPQQPMNTPLPPSRAALLRAATARGVLLRLMASGMSRALANTSRFTADRRQQSQGEGQRGGRGNVRGVGRGKRSGHNGGHNGSRGGARMRGDADEDGAQHSAAAAGGVGSQGGLPEQPMPSPPQPPSAAELAETAPAAEEAPAASRAHGLLHWRVELHVASLGLSLVAERAAESIVLLELLRATVEGSAHGATARRPAGEGDAPLGAAAERGAAAEGKARGAGAGVGGARSSRPMAAHGLAGSSSGGAASGSGVAALLPTMSGVVQRHRLAPYLSGLAAEEAAIQQRQQQQPPQQQGMAGVGAAEEAGDEVPPDEEDEELPRQDGTDGLPAAMGTQPSAAASGTHSGAAAPAAAAPAAARARGSAGLALLMRDESARSDARGYFRLPLSATLGEALCGCVIVEFPTMHLLTEEEAAARRADGTPLWPTVPHPAALG